MIPEHIDQLKEKMIFRSFVAEEQSYHMRISGRSIVPESGTAEDFEQVVREEAERVERTANVVTAVSEVTDKSIEIGVLVGDSADKELIEDMMSKLDHRVYTSMMDDDPEP